MRVVVCVAIALALPVITTQAPPQKFAPDPIIDSDLVVSLELAGRTPTRGNYTSPVVAGRRHAP